MGPGDRFHAFVDRRMRATGGAGNVCQCVVALDGGVDLELLRARAERVPNLTVEAETTASDPDAEAMFADHWAAPAPPPDGAVRLRVVRGPCRTAVVLRWPHARMDAPGADRLLQLLEADDPSGFRIVDAPSTLAARARGRRGRFGTFVAAHALALRTLASVFAASPWRPERTEAPPQVVFHTFTAGETTRIRARLGPAGNHRLLAAAAGGVAAALGARGDLLVPCPLDLRPGSWKGPILSNYFSTVVLRLPVALLAEGGRAAEAVREGFLAALRRGEDAVLPHLFALVGRVPEFVTRALFGARDPSSLLYSNVTWKVGRDGTWMGAPVLRVLLAAQTAPDPGVCVMLTTCAGRLTVAIPTHGVDGRRVLKAVGRRIDGAEAGWSF